MDDQEHIATTALAGEKTYTATFIAEPFESQVYTEESNIRELVIVTGVSSGSAITYVTNQMSLSQII